MITDEQFVALEGRVKAIEDRFSADAAEAWANIAGVFASGKKPPTELSQKDRDFKNLCPVKPGLGTEWQAARDNFGGLLAIDAAVLGLAQPIASTFGLGAIVAYSYKGENRVTFPDRSELLSSVDAILPASWDLGSFESHPFVIMKSAQTSVIQKGGTFPHYLPGVQEPTK